MSVFAVYRKPDADPDDVIFVREGFAWPAFVFTVFWALSKRLLVVALLLFVAFLAIQYAARYLGLPPTMVGSLELALSLLYGLEAATLRGWSLRRAGYEEIGLATGHSLTEAELHYFCTRKRVAAAEKPAADSSLRAPSGSHDTLGLFGAA